MYTILVRGEVPRAVRVERCSNGRRLKIFPKGIRINDGGYGLKENEVRSALKAVLQCLAYIHSKWFVHRDIRWANIIQLIEYTPDNVEIVSYLVIDFEFAAKLGDPMEIYDYIHKHIVSYGESYYARHDMKLVAKLVQTWAESNNVVLSEDALNFVDSLRIDVGNLEAVAALEHIWLRE